MLNLLTLWFGGLLSVRSENPELVRKGRLLGMLILGAIVGIAALTVMNTVRAISKTEPATVSYAVGDALTLLLTIGVLRLNQIGRTRLASYLFLTFFTLATSFMFPISALSLVFIIYVVPVLGASFVLYPPFSFAFALLATATYTISHLLRNTPAATYNYVSVIALYIVALLAWLAAANLENALREIRQRAAELDHRVMERTSDLADALAREHAEASKTQAILQSIGDGVIVFDENQKAIVVNPAIRLILDRSEEEVMGRTISDIMSRSVSAEDQAVIRSLIDTEGRARAGIKIAWDRKTIGVGFAPVHLPFTDQFGTVMVFRDITREAEVDRMKSEFVSIVSHELRTPMTAIKGYLDLLIKGSAGPLTDMQNSFLGIVKSNSNRLSEMVDELLDISRIEAGKVQMRFQPVSIGTTIAEITTMLGKSFSEKGLELRINLPADLPDVLSDPGRLAQIITNLLSNSLKYTFSGYVEVSAQVTSEKVLIQVSDTGIGMSEEDAAKLFTRFFRASTAKSHDIPGTGLGLSITRSLIELHGGQIWVNSKIGQGTVFSFTLPAVPHAVSRAAATIGAGPFGRARNAPGKILIVDDEIHIAQLFRHQLEEAGHSVLITTRGSDVLPLARRERPDLILLDILLPDIDGFEVLNRLKQDEVTQAIPVIITSIIADQEKGLAMGAADYLTKPMEAHQLLASVNQILDIVSPHSGPPPTVLVVDDEPDIRRWLNITLSEQGYRVCEAQDGEEALRAVNASRPNLILLDLNMPKVDGWSVIRTLKASPTTSGIPIIVLTASPLDPQRDRIQVLGMGARQFLTKPISSDMLLEEIRKQWQG